MDRINKIKKRYESLYGKTTNFTCNVRQNGNIIYDKAFSIEVPMPLKCENFSLKQKTKNTITDLSTGFP